MKLYTKTGDDGETGLLGGVRVAKDDARIEAIGTIDEFNCCLGILADSIQSSNLNSTDDLLKFVSQTQNVMFDVGATLAGIDTNQTQQRDSIVAVQITRTENEIDRLDEQVPELAHFILPGGCSASAQSHFARAVCRRAERRLVTLSQLYSAKDKSTQHIETQLQLILVLLNRLGDWLFVVARVLNYRSNVEDKIWSSEETA